MINYRSNNLRSFCKCNLITYYIMRTEYFKWGVNTLLEAIKLIKKKKKMVSWMKSVSANWNHLSISLITNHITTFYCIQIYAWRIPCPLCNIPRGWNVRIKIPNESDTFVCAFGEYIPFTVKFMFFTKNTIWWHLIESNWKKNMNNVCDEIRSEKKIHLIHKLNQQASNSLLFIV